MAGSDDRDPEDFYPKLSSGVSQSTEDGQQHSTARTITPRGHRFTSLGEAYQAITLGLASRSSSRLASSEFKVDEAPSDDSSVGPDVNSSTVADRMLDLQHLERGPHLSSGYSAEGRCLTKLPSAQSFDVDDYAVSPEKPPERPVRIVFHRTQLCSSSRGFDSDSNGQLPNGRSDSNGQLPNGRSDNIGLSVDFSGHAAENIRDEFIPTNGEVLSLRLLPPSSSSSGFNTGIIRGGSSSDHALIDADRLSSVPVLCNRDGAVSKLGFRSEDLLESSETTNSVSSNSQQRFDRHPLYFPPGTAPEIPLPELPRPQSDALLFRVGSRDARNRLTAAQLSPSTAADSQNLLCGPAESAQGPSSEYGSLSPIDRYGGKYTVAPLRIRSLKDQARHESLQNTSGGFSREGFSSGALSTESDHDPFRYDRYSWQARNLFVESTRERDISTALRRVSGVSTIFGDREGASDQPSSSLVALQFPGGFPNRIGRSYRSDNPFRDQSTMAVCHAPAALFSHGIAQKKDDAVLPVQGEMSYRLMAEPNSGSVFGLTRGHFASYGDEWETVATSHGAFDSNRAVVSGSTDDHLVKFAGSSIADYSDSASLPAASFSDFGSTERILQHPNAGEISGQDNLNLRTLKDTGRPVFLPKPRTHRINGYPQDSCRVFTDPVSNDSAGTSKKARRLDHMIDALRNRASRNSYQNLEKRSSRVDSQDSDMFEKAEKTGGLSRYTGVNGRRYSILDRRVDGTPDRGATPTGEERDFAYPQADGSIGRRSSNQFGFSLVTLDEFAKRQATGRASGEEDQTFVDSSHGRRASSAASSRRTESTQKTSPQTPACPVAKPRQALLFRCRASNVPDEDRDGADVYELQALPPRAGLRRTRKPRGVRIPTLVNRRRGHHLSSSLSSATYGSFHTTPSYPIPLSAAAPPHLSHHGENESLAGFGYGALNEEESRQRQLCWFYFMCALCTVPFIAPLVFAGKFDGALSWITRGSKSSLDRLQKRRLKVVAGVASALWLCALVVLIAVLVGRARYYH